MLSWTAFNKPLRITTAGSTWVEFSYNADQERVLQSNDGGDKLVYIAGSVRFEHEKRAGGQDVYTHYLGGAGGSFGIVKSHAVGGVPSSQSEAYLHRDHLGSVTLLTGNNRDRHRLPAAIADSANLLNRRSRHRKHIA